MQPAVKKGEIIEPEFSSQTMRHGPTPLIRKCQSAVDEVSYIKNTILALRQEGFPERQIVILVRYKRDMDNIQRELRGSGASVYMIHSFKGLEMDAVIIPHLQSTFINSDEEVAERCLIYMAMSRARSRLYMTYTGKLPQAYRDLRSQGLVDFIE
jgi:superfamily I DNA/RNA helicase